MVWKTDMRLGFVNEYPDVLVRDSDKADPSRRLPKREVMTEWDGKSGVVCGPASPADPVGDRRTECLAECEC